MGRIDNLPENQLETRIEAILSEIEALKNKQLTGSNNLIIYHTKTNNTWDVNETVLGTTNYVKWRVTFTPDTVNRPFTQFQYERQLVDGGTPLDPADTLNEFSAYVDPETIDDSSVSFIVEMINVYTNDTTARLKFAFKSLDTGSISWARIEEL